MTAASLNIRQATPEDRPFIESLLAANDLPTDDVEQKLSAFVVGSHGGERVCVGAVEVHGTAGLLRSVAVAERARGAGFGTELCERLEDRARSQGVETLSLLTTTATEFFAARGYSVVERSAAPQSLQETTQFAELCPASATCLQKPL